MPHPHERDRDRPARLHIINVGGDTAYGIELGGHQLTITHTDDQRRANGARHKEQCTAAGPN
ncbi:hypothetical protein QBA54_35340 [Streptomyces sp. B21-108]|uniref:hypothetical protein n=1 Tax=Streptomyces sp. B21-108 TaxID=3039419 RepID=UPI002FF13135